MVPIVAFIVGFTLVYAAVKDMDPRDIIKNVIRGDTPDMGSSVVDTNAVAPIPPPLPPSKSRAANKTGEA